MLVIDGESMVTVLCDSLLKVIDGKSMIKLMFEYLLYTYLSNVDHDSC